MLYEMKYSGVEWIGEIPHDWNISKLKDVAQLFGRIGYRGYTTNDLVAEGEGAITLSPSNILDDKVQFNKCSYLSWYKYNESPEIQVHNGDIIFVKTGASYGKNAIIKDLPMEATINPQLIVIKNIQCNNRFLMYNLQSIGTFIQCEQNVVGGTIPTISQSKIEKFIFALPPLPEQQSIASYLDEKCTAIDEIIAEAKATIDEYKSWKASVIFEAVTKGLNPNAEMKDSGVDIIGQMPNHWSLIRQRFLCKTTTGDHDTQDANPDGQYPFYVRSPNVERSDTYTFEGEGILMAGDGVGAGKVFHYATGKYAIHQRVYCFYDFQKIVTRFYYYFMSSLFSTEIDKGSAKSTVASVRLPMLKDFPICLPSQNEQDKIVAYLDEKCAAIDDVIAEKEALIGELESYKKSLIFETVTGKRRVC